MSIWWMILLLTLLALLLGPVDYYVLKRRDRLPWTWLTCTGWIVLFTVGSYYGVQALRGGRMRVAAVGVLDGVQGGSWCWSATYSGLFAPKSDAYQLEFPESAGKQWWSGIAPSGEYYSVYEQRAGRRILCAQADGENRPISLPINIWTMQTLMTEAPLPRLPFDASVRRQGRQVALRITNYSDTPIKRGYMLFNEDLIGFQSVPAGQTLEMTENLTGRADPNSGGEQGKKDIKNVDGTPGTSRPDSNRGGGQTYREIRVFPPFRLSLEAAFSAQGTLQRTRTIQEYLRHGAAVVYVEFDDPAAPFRIKDRKCRFDYSLMGRLVVFPQERELP